MLIGAYAENRCQDSDLYYPIRIGDTYNSRYQVVAKLGYGSQATVWLCHDTAQSRYLALKVYMSAWARRSIRRELAVSKYLKSIEWDHPGKGMIRTVEDHFQIEHRGATHDCLVFRPAGIRYTDYRNRMPSGVFPSLSLLQQTLRELLTALDFLHQAQVTHGDLSPNKLLMGVKDQDVFANLEATERENPAPRKYGLDRVVYSTCNMPLTEGIPVLNDLGQARIGPFHTGDDVMPDVNRAPEVILGAGWGPPIDMWSVGLMVWNLFEGKRLFHALNTTGQVDDESHIAEMVGLLGPPPDELLERSPKCDEYWDRDCRWIASSPIPTQTLESREVRLTSPSAKHLLLGFARRVLQWLPESRATAKELLEDPFITTRLGVDDK
ncbi:protein kinase [Elsinoe ampelina]|uniref:Protein kinase n=1 Tax=Elsinoe ampelina TaxID=302913 RepID=A0A6A6FYU8_9PEZI|nr:protein kinase [Elsinoe ampelina]